MNSYLALTTIDLKLALRDKQVLFFNYVFPLIFFFFAALFHADRSGGAISTIVTNVLVIGVLGNGFFGAGLRAVQEREQDILRRYKVTPITPMPLLVASLSTGLLLYIPAALLVFALAHTIYGMPLPDRPFSLMLFLATGMLAFRGIGLIVAAVANSMAESQLLVQALYMPMLFLSGAMFPASTLPRWTQTLAQFLPASYLVSGVQSIVTQHESLAANWPAGAALLLTLALSIFIASRLFRWEKEEKLRASAKLWVLGIMAPFLLMGVYQFQTSDQIARNRILWRQLRRDDAFLIRNARVFIGDGRAIETGSVLVRHGKIDKVYDGAGPDGSELKADVIEASGKTVMPGLIDVHVHLGAPGGFLADQKDAAPDLPARALTQYLYSGVTTVKSTGDALDGSILLRDRVNSGDFLGAELYVSGPLFTTEDGHGTEYFRFVEGPARAAMMAEFVRTPGNPDQARAQVRALQAAGVDAIKAVLESGRAGLLFARMDLNVFRAVVEEAKAQRLPTAVHTGNARDVIDALEAGARSIEHGSFNEAIPDDALARLAAAGVAYDPTLSVIEALADLFAGKGDLLRRSLVQQAVPQKLLSDTIAQLKKGTMTNQEQSASMRSGRQIAEDNLVRAWKAGVPLVAGSDAGNMLVFHGPTVHREMQLWVDAGIPPAVALQAATWNAAKLLGAESRIGLIAEGHVANLLVVDGDPTRDIGSTERVSLVVLKGERVRRAELFDAARNPVE